MSLVQNRAPRKCISNTVLIGWYRVVSCMIFTFGVDKLSRLVRVLWVLCLTCNYKRIVYRKLFLWYLLNYSSLVFTEAVVFILQLVWAKNSLKLSRWLQAANVGKRDIFLQNICCGDKLFLIELIHFHQPSLFLLTTSKRRVLNLKTTFLRNHRSRGNLFLKEPCETAHRSGHISIAATNELVLDRWHMKHLLKEAERENGREEEERESEIGLPADSLGRNRFDWMCCIWLCKTRTHTHRQTQWVKVTGEAALDHSVVESRAARFLRRNLLDSLSGVCGMVNAVRRCRRDSECYFQNL